MTADDDERSADAVWHWAFQAVPDSVAQARHQVLEALANLSMEVLPRVAVVVTELVTNAVRYGGADVFRLSLFREPTYLRVEVIDGNPDQLPKVLSLAPAEASGRGLRLVEALADRWGAVVDSDGTKSTWAEVRFI